MGNETEPRMRVRWCAASGVPCERFALLETQLGEAGVELAFDDSAETTLFWMGGLDEPALEALRELALRGRARVLVLAENLDALAGQGEWRLLAAGASDVVAWDGEAEVALAIAARLRRWAAVDRLLEEPVVREHLVGGSAVWIAALRQLVELAAFTDASLLLTGDTGVGKEEAARLVHALDGRAKKGELVLLDCTTVVPELSGSEFFGHEKGAFTGAAVSREGAFALADGGTLFLDEVGELSPPLQAQLLRVIQEGTYKRVGADVWRRVNLRLVCATNRDLAAEVERGRFRRDLYHRIASSICRLPSLRERPGDVLPLTKHFLREALGGNAPVLSSAVEAFLLDRAYPGNVRDLRQLALRMAKRHVGRGPITIGDIPPDDRPCGNEPAHWPDASLETSVRHALNARVGLKDIGRIAGETAIRLVLEDEAGNLQRAARRLGVTDRALQFRRARKASAGT